MRSNWGKRSRGFAPQEAVLVGVAILGAAFLATRVPDQRLSFGPKTLVFTALLCASAVVIVTARPVYVLSLLLAIALLGRGYNLFGGFMDTRVWAFPAAALACLRLIEQPRQILQGQVVDPRFIVGWLLVLVGTSIAALVNGLSMGSVVDWLLVGLFAFAAAGIARLCKPYEALAAWAAVSVLMSLTGIAQDLGLPGAPSPYSPTSFETQRLDAFFGHPNTFATYAMLSSLIAAALALSRSAPRRWRQLGVLSLGLALVCLLLTASRGATGATAACFGAVLVVSLLRSTSLSVRERRSALTASVVLLLLGLFVFGASGGALRTRFTDGELAFNNEVRGNAIVTGWRLVEKNPWLGVGAEQFQDAAYVSLQEPVIVQHAHNVFLTVWVERGLLGFLGLALMVALPLLAVVRARRTGTLSLPQILLGVGIPLGVLLHGSVEYLLLEQPGRIVVVTALALAVVVLEAIRAQDVPADRATRGARPRSAAV